MRISRPLAAVVVLLCVAANASATASTATTVFAVPGSFADCRARIAPAVAGEGFGSTRDFGNGLLGFRGEESVSVGCIRGEGETVVVITTTSCAANNPMELANRLAARMRGNAPSSPESAQRGCTFNYKGWDGSLWTARLAGTEFQHAPDGDWNRMHRDSIIRYTSWTTRAGRRRWRTAGSSMPRMKTGTAPTAT